MARFIKFKKENLGAAPDSLVFIGEKKAQNTRIRLISYNSEKLNEQEILEFEKSAIQISDSVLWFNVDGLHDIANIQKIKEELNLSSFVISNVLNTHNRPSFKEFENCFHIILKIPHYDSENNELDYENLSIIIKKNLLITFQEREGKFFEPVRERLRKNKKRLRSSKVDYLNYALIDVIIDHYLFLLSELGERIQDIDDELVKSPTKKTLNAINDFKLEMNLISKAVKPTKEMISRIIKSDSDFVENENLVFYHEILGNIDLALEQIESYKSILSDQLSVYHSTISANLNEILKVLTIFSVVFIPLTFIAGIYGTNFENIPELGFKYGYFGMWILFVLISGVMIYYFKRKKWL